MIGGAGSAAGLAGAADAAGAAAPAAGSGSAPGGRDGGRGGVGLLRFADGGTESGFIRTGAGGGRLRAGSFAFEALEAFAGGEAPAEDGVAAGGAAGVAAAAAARGGADGGTEGRGRGGAGFFDGFASSAMRSWSLHQA